MRRVAIGLASIGALFTAGIVSLSWCPGRLSAQTARTSPEVTPTAVAFAPRRLVHHGHTRWSVADGLPEAGVSAVRRSADGYLWLGTRDGLVRFDGVRFVTIDSTVEPALRARVSGPVLPLHLDSTGVLWIARADGALLHYRDGHFRVAYLPASPDERITSLTPDGAGRLWVNGSHPYLIDGEGRRQPMPLPPGVLPTEVQGVAADTGRGMWMGTRRGALWHLRADGTASQRAIRYDGDGGVRPVLQSRDGTLWLLNGGTQYLRDGRWTAVRAPKSATGNVNGTRAAELPDGSVVITTRGYGVLRVHHETVDAFIERDGLSDAVTRAVFVDTDGTVWITTDGGLDRLRRSTFLAVGAADGLSLETPAFLHADAGGAFWMKDFGFPSLLRVDGGVVRGAAEPLRVTEVRPPVGDRYFPVGVARGGGVYAIDAAARLVHVDVGKRRLVHAWRGQVPRRVLETRDGALWVGFNNEGGGVGVLRDGRYTPLDAPELARNSWGVQLVEDSLGGVWAQTSRPSVLFHLVRGRIVARHYADSGAAFAQFVVQGGDTLWGIHGTALVRFIGDRRATVEVPGTRSVLRGASAALQLAGGALWLASSTGVGRLPLGTLHAAADGRAPPPSLERFGASDGLRTPGLSASDPQATLVDRAGHLWLATPAGLLMADLRTPPPPLAPPQTLIESVEVGGRTYTLDTAIVLQPRPDRVTLRFTATALSAPERVRLQFRLDGVDTSWQDVTGPRVTTYTQLRHGRYRFRVRSWLDGRTVPVERALTLRVPPAWFESLWFAVLLALLLTAVVTGGAVAGTRVVLRGRARRAAEQQQARFDAELGERTRLARELHDTLLQGFTGITLQLQAVQSQLPAAASEASTALERILSLADASLREARTMVWDMRAPSLARANLASALEADGRAVIGDAALALTVLVTGEPRRVSAFIETAVLRVGREAMTNSLRHAHASRLHVTLSYAPDALTLTVDDDGRGLDTATIAPSHTGGWGVRGMRERAAQVGGRLVIARVPTGGTRVQMIVPLDSSLVSPPGGAATVA